MNFNEALETLGIEEYSERIFNSNSQGELFHLHQYFLLAEMVKDLEIKEWFKEWFKVNVEYAEKNWNRPESIFQHVHQLLNEQLKEEHNSRKL